MRYRNSQPNLGGTDERMREVANERMANEWTERRELGWDGGVLGSGTGHRVSGRRALPVATWDPDRIGSGVRHGLRLSHVIC